MIASAVRVAAVALAALALGGSTLPAPRPGAGPREARALAAGERAVERVAVPAGHLVEIVVAQLEGDVAVALRAPDGKVIAEGDLPGKPWLEEYLAAIVDEAGDLELEIRAVDGAARYRAHHPAMRAIRPGDQELLEAAAAWNRARALRDLQTEENTQEALGLLDSAAARLRELHEPILLGRVLEDLGVAYQSLGRVEEAETVFTEGIATFEGTGHDVLLSEMLNYRADTLVNRGRGDEAEPLYERALSLATSAGDARMEARTHNNLGVLYYQRGELDLVVERFERALGLFEQSGDSGETANTLRNLGAVYRVMGRYSDALEVSRRALDLARALDDRRQAMGVLNNRGVLFKAVGDLRAAADSYTQALILARELGSADNEATVAINLGSLYRSLGRPERARELLEAALSSRGAIDPIMEVRGRQLLGELLREDGDFEAAASLFGLAQARAEAAGDRGAVASSLFLRGRVEFDGGRYETALEFLTAALEVQEENKDRAGTMATRREMGRALAALDREAEARAAFENSIAIAQAVGDPHQEAAGRGRLARLLADSGELEAAREEVEAALEIVESLRRQVVQPEDRAGFLSRNQRDFRLLIEVLAAFDRREPESGFAAEAFLTSERARARSLVELMIEAEADLLRDLPPEVRQQRDDLAGLLSASQRRLTEALRSEIPDSAEVERLRSRIADLNRQREDLDRHMRRSDPRWDALRYPDPAGVETVRRSLDDRTALVSYVLGEKRSFVFVVTRSATVLREMSGEDRLIPLIEAFRAQLEAPGRRAIGRLQVTAAALHREVFAPVEGDLREIDELIVVPDGLLHYVPFEALVTGLSAAGDPEYLLQRWAVTYAPSASTVQALEQRARAGARRHSLELVAFADPELPGSTPASVGGGPVLRGVDELGEWRWRALQGARREVEAISRLFAASRTRVFLGRDATEARFKEDPGVRSARFVHVAAHALIDNREPALSSLLFGRGGQDQDGLLQAHEVFDLRLEADLVVLSGCETALGRAVRGEGLVGLVQAFLHSGAGAVSVSLWPVEDSSTAELMAAFYDHMSRGFAPGEAMRRAKLARLDGGPTAHPYYWAPFVLVGATG